MTPKDKMCEIVFACTRRDHILVHAHGVFDLLHLGHTRHLQAARAMGDKLIVTVTSDRYVTKGPGRPVFPAEQRAEMLAALDCVDYVAISDHPTAIEAINKIRPDIFVKGHESRVSDGDVATLAAEELAAVSRHGGRVAFTDELTMSSTSLINRHVAVFDEAVEHALAELRATDAKTLIHAALNAMSSLRLLFIGDNILDEYEYVIPVGKSIKANMLSSVHVSSERFTGGVHASANHARSFCAAVDVVTGAEAVIKRRFVDAANMEKLFEVNYREPSGGQPIDGMILERIAAADVVVVNDFGHDAIGESAINLICRHAKFLAVNTQTNTLNFGFNLITKYPRADYLCIDLPEARLAAQDRTSSSAEIARKIAGRIQCGKIIITQGKEGCVVYDNGRELTVAALAGKVVDTVGAGDAFLAITAPLVAAGLPLDLCGFVGNVAAGIKVGIVGHRQSVDRSSVVKGIDSLLK